MLFHLSGQEERADASRWQKGCGKDRGDDVDEKSFGLGKNK